MKISLKFILITLSFIFLLCPLSFLGCSDKVFSYDFSAFNSPCRIEVYNKEISEEVKTKIQDLILELENESSLDDENSTISKINSLSANEKIEVSDTFLDIFNAATFCNGLSNGKFDITILPLLSLWNFYPYNKEATEIPNDNEINALRESKIIGQSNVKLQERQISKQYSDTKLDFGGIIKGYFADKIYEILNFFGYQGGYVSIGTSSLFLLDVDSISIKHPRSDGQILKIKSPEKNIAVSTSGDYEKFYTVNDKEYCHIIDISTYAPINTGLISITLFSESGAISDALSTALITTKINTQNPTNESEFISTINNVSANEHINNLTYIAIFNDGDKKFILTNEKESKITLFDKSYSLFFS